MWCTRRTRARINLQMARGGLHHIARSQGPGPSLRSTLLAPRNASVRPNEGS
jgi:hypothetical protein